MQIKRYLPILNVLAFIGVIIMNYLATSLPLAGRDTGEISDLYPNLFAPAGFTFAIWGVIYLLLAAFVVFQLKNTGKKDQPGYLNKIGWLFIISCLANASWLFAWHNLKIGLALIIMLVILGSLLAIYLKLNIGKTEVTTKEKLLAHVPFSVYLGWITVATIANITIFLVSIGWEGAPFNQQFWTVITIIAALAVNLFAIYRRRDYAFGIVGAWALFGIYSKRSATDTSILNGSVEIIAVTGIAVLLISIFMQIFLKRK